jgi:hypothetical protein
MPRAIKSQRPLPPSRAARKATPVNYMILIHNDERAWSAMTDEQRQQSFTAYMAYNAMLAKAGALKAGEQLLPSQASKTLRKKGASVISTDGPFAETREQLGGYYILECATEAQALTLAGQCPGLDYGGVIEVRPIFQLDKGL